MRLQEGTDLVPESLGVDGLCQVADAASLKHAPSVVRHGVGRQRNDGYRARGRIVAELPGRSEPVKPRQLNIHEDDIGAEAPSLLDRFHSVLGHYHGVPVQLEQVLDQLEVQGIVFGDEDSQGGRRHFPPPLRGRVGEGGRARAGVSYSKPREEP